MHGTSFPYRSLVSGPVSRTAVPMAVVPRRYALLLAVVVMVPTLLHVFLWSRVVVLRCAREGSGMVACQTHESSLGWTNALQTLAEGPLRAELRGATNRSRGDTWIALVGAAGEVPVTSGFNGDKGGQRAAVADVRAFLSDARRGSVVTGFGSRWSTAFLFLAVYGALSPVVYAMFAQRLWVSADWGLGTLEVRRGIWPLRGKPTVLAIRGLRRFEARPEGTGRFQLVALTEDTGAVPLSWRLGVLEPLVGTAHRLNAWIDQEQRRLGAEAFAPAWEKR